MVEKNLMSFSPLQRWENRLSQTAVWCVCGGECFLPGCFYLQENSCFSWERLESVQGVVRVTSRQQLNQARAWGGRNRGCPGNHRCLAALLSREWTLFWKAGLYSGNGGIQILHFLTCDSLRYNLNIKLMCHILWGCQQYQIILISGVCVCVTIHLCDSVSSNGCRYCCWEARLSGPTRSTLYLQEM